MKQILDRSMVLVSPRRPKNLHRTTTSWLCLGCGKTKHPCGMFKTQGQN